MIISKVRVKRKRKSKMIEKWYEVSCDICGYGLRHYVRYKPTPTELRREGVRKRNLGEKVSGKGTWESNTWVFAYEFELVD